MRYDVDYIALYTIAPALKSEALASGSVRKTAVCLFVWVVNCSLLIHTMNLIYIDKYTYVRAA